MKEIIICVGIPGSGKSTFAKKWVSVDPINRIRINNEDILNSMVGKYIKSVYGYIKYTMVKNIVEDMVDAGKSIVLDNTHIKIEHFRHIFNTVNTIIFNKNKINEYNIIIKDFTGIDPSICIDRDSKRIKPVGEEEINRCYLSRLNNIKSYLELIGSTDFGYMNVKIDKMY